MAKKKINRTKKKRKNNAMSLRATEEMIITEAEVIEERLLENNLIQGIFSFIIAFIVYIAEVYFYSINYVLASIVFFVVLVIAFIALRAILKPKKKRK